MVSVLLVSALAVFGCGSNDPAQIKTLSNRADLVSDGDALAEIVLPKGASAKGLKVDVGGRDVSDAFAVRGDGRLLGVVTGLAAGDNVVTARADGASAAQLTITNAPRGGPVYSGNQPAPFICATPTPQAASGATPATNASGLTTAATDAQCNIATEHKLYYRTTVAPGAAPAGCSFSLPDPSPSVPYTSTTVPANPAPPANPCFKVYDPNAAAPADLASTTTDAGVTVPYIVRVERGTMNRGIYDIAVLFDPTRPWTATDPQAQWNGKILYQFGASTGQPRRQARPATAWTDDKSLSRGYMVVSNSMTDSLQNSNRVMMTETVMMMKEHIYDSYGPIKFTMGAGCSGGSINSNTSASINPGLLDGVTVSCTYPDSETTAIEVGDCVVLVEAYQKAPWTALMAGLTQAQINAKKAAINGHLDQSACHGWFNFFGSNSKAGNYVQRLVPAASNDTGVIVDAPAPTNNCQLPAAVVYDPVTNPNGPRCNGASWAESIWGKVPGQPFARDTRDNVGVQYGLKALLADAITGEEFVTLNELVGGSDHDSNLVATRTVADAEALDIAYRSGIVMSAKQLAKAAVVDMRGYDDSLVTLPPGLLALGLTPAQLEGVATFGIHHQWRSFAIRDRLDRDAGGHANQVMWRFGRSGFSPSASMALDAFTTMDQWLTSLKADTSASSLEDKVKNARPAGASDFCLLSTDAAQTTKVTDFAQCDADPFLAVHSSPRQVAGGPRSEDILKCQLRPVNAAEYGGRLDAAQLTRLDAVFPDGVCDWTKPGVGQQAAVSPLSFKAGPGGQPFGAEPVSKAK